jgi:hypothetical protein
MKIQAKRPADEQRGLDPSDSPETELQFQLDTEAPAKPKTVAKPKKAMAAASTPGTEYWLP